MGGMNRCKVGARAVLGLSTVVALVGCNVGVPSRAPATSPSLPITSFVTVRGGAMHVDGVRVADDDAIVAAVLEAREDQPALAVMVVADPATPIERLRELEHRVERDTGVAVVVLQVDVDTAPGRAPAAEAAAPNEAAPVSLDEWRCAYPYRAHNKISVDATADIVVQVDAQGAPRKVWIGRESGHDAGIAAVACAMTARYVAAKNENGRPIDGATRSIRVRFDAVEAPMPEIDRTLPGRAGWMAPPLPQ